MLTLIEPNHFNMNEFSDRPHLGCAMLIAVCQERGIKTSLIKGQTRYVKDMFVNDSEELWNLVHDLKEDDLKKIGIVEYKRSIQEKGIRQFQDELKNLYQNIFINKNIRHCFNFQMAENFRSLYNVFVRIYSYYLINLNFDNLNLINRYVSETLNKNPRYIGFSVDHRSSFSRIICKRIKETAGVPIIMGGSLTPFLSPKSINEIFEKEFFDYLVVGAGDHALPALIEALDNNEEPKGIANVFYKKDGEIKSNDLKAVNDLDSLPYPDFSQFDLDLYPAPERVLPLQAARGCSWGKCTFCDYHRITFGGYKEFSIKRIMDIIIHLNTTYNCKHFEFHNDDFPPERVKKFSNAVLKSKLKKPIFHIYARPEDKFNDNKLLSLMHRAGIAQIYWGIESACQRVLNMMAKGTRVSTLSQILKKSTDNKISNICLAFFGFPGETTEEAQQTVEFLKNHSDYMDNVGLQTFILSSFSKVAMDSKNILEIKDDGSYSVKRGKTLKESGMFYEEIVRAVLTGSINVTREDVRFVPSGFYHGILYALVARHGLMSKKTILKCLKKARLNNIFPIMLGEIKKKNNRNVLCPANSMKTSFINGFIPEKEKKIDKLEEKIFILSDGKSSIEEIIQAIYKDFKGKHSKRFVHKKCVDFFRGTFSKNWSVGFSKSWRSLS